MDAVKNAINEASAESFVAVLAFTRRDFDNGIAHEAVKRVTGHADLFPGAWRETWRYVADPERWVVTLETLD